MPSRLTTATAPRAGKVIKSAKQVSATKAKTRRRRGTGSRGPRVVARNVSPAIVAMSRALRDARVRSGLSKADAAEKVGVHFVTLYAWENENRTDQPSEENLARAARAYGTTPETLHRRAKAIEPGISATAPSSSADGASAAGGKAEPTRRQSAQGTKSVGSNNHTATKAKKARQSGRGGSTVARKGSVSGMNHASVTLSGQAYARVLRVLADLAEELSLPPATLGSAQQALTAPGLLDVFAAFSPEPLTNDDVLAAIDAAGVAVRSFVSGRRRSAGQR
jgi:transcriptional regulator with XRE-family HTH domain